MTTNELYINLKEAYSNTNLNKITVTLINLYREEQFGTLRQITEMIGESIEIPYDSDSKAFSRMMMLYHPDRGDFHRNEIDRLAETDDRDGLLNYAHILMLSKIEEIASTLSSYEDIDYSPVYEWDIDLNNFTIINTRSKNSDEESTDVIDESRAGQQGCTFYEGIQLRMFGDTSTGFPSYYLEDLDEFELSQSGISDLDGVQHCTHAIVMDLSGNSISDISLLWNLTLLEELNLSGNYIHEIDSLVNLRNLKTLNLSHNAVRDVSYLLHLPCLEYVDLTGTKVNQSQINKLEETGVTVVF
jgi:Leucine-rich repeat (LRR) protein